MSPTPVNEAGHDLSAECVVPQIVGIEEKLHIPADIEVSEDESDYQDVGYE